MSVVNKMLQDLEARKNTPEMISADYVPPPSSKRNIWSILLVILALVLVAFLWFMGLQLLPSSERSTNLADSGTLTEQSNVQSKQPKIEKNIGVEQASSKENSVANNHSTRATSAPNESTTAPTTTESLPVKIMPMPVTQTTVQSGSKEPVTQSTNVAENVVENTDRKQAIPESRFSKSDSSEINKVAGAKQSVISALSDGDNNLAIRRLEELLRVQPNNIEARKKLAAILFSEKRSKQAEHVLLQGISKHPLRSDLRLMMARLYMQRKDNEAAIKLLSEVEPDTANQVEFLAYRAALLQQNARYEPAMIDYIKLLETDSSNPKWWLGLAITQDRLGQTTEALSAYRHAFDKEQLSPSVIKFIEQRMSQIEDAL